MKCIVAGVMNCYLGIRVDTDIEDKVHQTVLEVMSKELYEGPGLGKRFARAITVFLFITVISGLFVWWVANLRVDVLVTDEFLKDSRVFFITDCQVVGDIGCAGHSIYKESMVINIKNVGISETMVTGVTIGSCNVEREVLLAAGETSSFILPCGLVNSRETIKVDVFNKHTNIARQERGTMRNFGELSWLYNSVTVGLNTAKDLVGKAISPYLTV